MVPLFVCLQDRSTAAVQKNFISYYCAGCHQFYSKHSLALVLEFSADLNWIGPNCCKKKNHALKDAQLTLLQPSSFFCFFFPQFDQVDYVAESLVLHADWRLHAVADCIVPKVDLLLEHQQGGKRPTHSFANQVIMITVTIMPTKRHCCDLLDLAIFINNPPPADTRDLHFFTISVDIIIIITFIRANSYAQAATVMAAMET